MALKKFTYTSADDLYVGSPAQITLDSDKYGVLLPIDGAITEADDGDPENTYTVCYESDDLPAGVEFIDFCDVSQIDVDNLNCPETYSITTTAGSGGQIQPGNTEVITGQDALFQLTPDAGYSVSDLLVDGVSVGSDSTYQFINVTQNHTIEAVFSLSGPSGNEPLPSVVTVTGTDNSGGAILTSLNLDTPGLTYNDLWTNPSSVSYSNVNLDGLAFSALGSFWDLNYLNPGTGGSLTARGGTSNTDFTGVYLDTSGGTGSATLTT